MGFPSFTGFTGRTRTPSSSDGFLAPERGLRRDQRGQATVEYILILSVTILGAAGLSRAIVGAFDSGILRFGAALEQDLRTGRSPLDIWKN